MELKVRLSEDEDDITGSGEVPITLVEELPVESDGKKGTIKLYSDVAWPFLLRRLRALFAVLADTPTYVESGYQGGYQGEHSDIGLGNEWNVVFVPTDPDHFEYALIEPSNGPPSIENPHPDLSDIELNYVLSIGGIVLEKGDLATSLYEASREYKRLCEQAAGNEEAGSGAVNDGFLTLYAGLEEIVSHYRDRGTLRDFRHTPEGEFVQRCLYHEPTKSSDIGAYLTHKGIIRDEISRIQQNVGDDQIASEMYDDLLTHVSQTIRAGSAVALAENPDERAREALHKTRWTEYTDVVPHSVRALVELGGDDVRRGLLELLDFSEEEPIRKAAVEGLATFDDEDVRNALREIEADADEYESPRRTARDSLQRLDSE
jgi:hypothetical protein